MTKHLGDFDTSAVIYGKFTTFRPSTGAAYTLGGTPALSVYKDNSTTQSTTGVTLTADFDSVTGLNHFAIDTSADGTFYSSGSFFDIVITTGTVDSVSVVGAVVGSFTLRKNSALKPTTAGRTLDVSAGGEAGLDWANVGSPTTTVSLSGTTVATTTTATNVTTVNGLAANVITATSIAADAITAAKVASDVSAEIADAVWDEDATGHQTTGTFGQAIGDPGANTETLYKAIVTDAAGTNIAADVIAIKAETASILTDTAEIGVAGAGLTNINLPDQTMNITGNITGNLSGSVGSVTGAVGSVTAGVTVTTNNDKTGYALSAAGVDAIWDESLGGHQTVGTTGRALTLSGTILDETTATGTPTTTTLQLTAGSATDDFYNDLEIIPTTGTLAGQARIITDYTGATKTVTIDEPWTSAPSNGDGVIIRARHSHSIEQIKDGIRVELATELGRIDATISSRASQTSLDTLDDYVDTEVAAIKAKTDNLPASPAATGDIPSAATIADAVWDETLSGHLGAGSTGEALNAAGAAGDPWTTSLPGAYGAGSAGYIIGNNLDAAVSSRLASASYTAPLDAAGTRTAVGLASANLDTQLSTIDTVVDAVKVKTDSLTFTVAGQVDSNIQYVNDVQVTGDGQAGTEWGPA